MMTVIVIRDLADGSVRTRVTYSDHDRAAVVKVADDRHTAIEDITAELVKDAPPKIEPAIEPALQVSQPAGELDAAPEL